MTAQKKTPAVGETAGGKSKNSESTDTLPEQSKSDNCAVLSPYGAPPGDWTHFDLILELTEDLLPVVSNPNAVKSPNSKIQTPGKIPTQYDKRRQFTGFSEWPKHKATAADITKWMKEPDYGICLITRYVRAIDIDVGDFDEATDIEAFIDAHLGLKLPRRRRSNSTKFLMPFILPGTMPKRKFNTHTEDNFIEMLGSGQQFIACGTHTSGVRYEWDGGLPDSIPELTAEQFESLWTALEAKFASEKSVTTRAGNPDRDMTRNINGAPDPVVDYLYEMGLVTAVTASGDICVDCPEKHGHSADNGTSETVWHPAGTNGYAQGHFDCKHSSCKSIISSDRDYLEAIGYLAHGFEVVEVTDAEYKASVIDRAPPPKFTIIKSGHNAGKVKPSLENVTAALFRPDVCGHELRFDTFRHGAMLSPPGTDEWRALTDTDYSELRLQLAKPGYGHEGFDDIGKDNIRDAVDYVASKTPFDSAVMWLESLKWDGVYRVATFLQDYFGTKGNDYHRGVSEYIWTALAGRVLVPGIKADMVPVAVGRQGARKSSTVAAIAPASDFFIEADLSRDDDDLARLMRGKLVVELGELNGLRKREAEHIKTFLAKQHEEWTPKFKEFNTRYARRCLFFGTTNEPEFLADKTGHRRWLPFDAGECDPTGLAKMRDQLWAEARHLFQRDGIKWQDAEKLATAVHEKYVERDPWEESVIGYLLGSEGMDGPAPIDTPFTAVMVLRSALSIPVSQITKSHKDRMATLLAGISKKLRLVKCKPRIDGMQQRGYVRQAG